MGTGSWIHQSLSSHPRKNHQRRFLWGFQTMTYNPPGVTDLVATLGREPPTGVQSCSASSHLACVPAWLCPQGTQTFHFLFLLAHNFPPQCFPLVKQEDISVVLFAIERSCWVKSHLCGGGTSHCLVVLLVPPTPTFAKSISVNHFFFFLATPGLERWLSC